MATEDMKSVGSLMSQILGLDSKLLFKEPAWMKEIKPGDIVLGVMSRRSQALLTRMDEIESEIEPLDAQLEKFQNGGENFEQDMLLALLKKRDTLAIWRGILDSLLREEIELEFPSSEEKFEVQIREIRKGWKVVMIAPSYPVFLKVLPNSQKASISPRVSWMYRSKRVEA